MKSTDDKILEQLNDFRSLANRIILDSNREYSEDNYIPLKKYYEYAGNVDSVCCSECKGDCCKRCGCHFSPDDFPELSFEYLRKEIEKGYISIDYVPGELLLFNCECVYLLRIRNQNSPIVDLADFRLGKRSNPCILLKENGCSLDYEQRPSGGKLLIPSKTVLFNEEGKAVHQCFSQYTIDDCCYEWKHFQKILKRLKEYFSEYDANYPCLLGK